MERQEDFLKKPPKITEAYPEAEAEKEISEEDRDLGLAAEKSQRQQTIAREKKWREKILPRKLAHFKKRKFGEPKPKLGDQEELPIDE